MKEATRFLIALGLTLVALANACITTPVTNRYSFGDHLNLNVPGLVQNSIAKLSLNATNVTAIVRITTPSGMVKEVKTPYYFNLYPGDWRFQLVSELYVKEITQVVNVTEQTKCGNVTIQKVTTVPELVNSTEPIMNVTLTVTVYKMGVIGYSDLVELLGSVMTAIGALLVIVSRFRERGKFKLFWVTLNL